MSRFFYGNGSDSDSSESEEEVYSEEEEKKSDAEESSEEESSEDEEDEDEQEDSDEEAGGKTGANRFMKDVSESEESEDEEKVTVVKSAKDKRLEELENTIHLIDNAGKINDWAVISAGEFIFILLLPHRRKCMLTMAFRVREIEPPDRQGHTVWSHP